jgi:hypothetical protein
VWKLEAPETGGGRSIFLKDAKGERSAHGRTILTQAARLFAFVAVFRYVTPPMPRPMSLPMKLFPPLLALGLALSGCRHEHRESVVVVDQQSPAQPAVTTTVVYEERPAEVTVYRAPPPAPQEVVAAAPSERHVWINGYWVWRGRWEWVPGHWHVAPAQYRRWVSGRWLLQANGSYRWVGGHWEK